MKLTRRSMGVTFLSAVAVAALAWPAVAGQGDGPRGPRGHRMARILTQAQMDQVKPWLKAEREASQPLAALHRQLRDAVLSEAPDQGKIAALQSQIAPLQAEALTRRTALAQRIAALLTPEQRQQIRSSPFVPPFLDPAGGGRPPMGPGGMGPHGPRSGGPGGPPPDAQQ